MSLQKLIRSPRLPFAAVALALAVVTGYTLAFYFRMPMYEHMLLSPLLERMQNGEEVGWLEPGLNVIAGGHWYLIGQWVSLLLARLTHWNLLADALLILALLAGSCALLYRYVRTHFGTSLKARWLFAICACIALSVNQAVNLLWVSQLSHFIHGFCLVAAACIISRPLVSRSANLLLIKISVLITYSLASGLAVMLLLQAMLWHRRAGWGWRILWAAVFGLATWHYFSSYFAAVAEQEAQAGFVAQHVQQCSLGAIGNMALFVVNALGSPFARFAEDLAPFFGVAGLALCGASLIVLWQKHRHTSAWFGATLIALVSLAYLVLAAIGRYGFGAAQGLNPRYMNHGDWFWIGTFLLMAHARLRVAVPRRAIATAITVAALCFVANSYKVAAKEVRMSKRYAESAEHIRTHWPDVDMQMIDKISYNGTEQPMRMLEIMKRLRYNLFRE